MRTFLIGVGASITAGAVTYLVFDWTDVLPSRARVWVAVAVALVGLAIAWLAGRRSPDRGQRDIAVADGIRSSGDISLEDVTLPRAEGSVRVGTRWRSGAHARIKGIRIGGTDDAT